MKPCKRLLVTAQGVRGADKVTTTNYNETECTGEPGNCGCIHAEEALLKKMPNPDLVVLSHSPCLKCAKLLVEANVLMVSYKEEYRLKEGIDYLIKHGVSVLHSKG